MYEPRDFLAKLAALIPRPHKNLVIYHGVLAANAAWRARVEGFRRHEADDVSGSAQDGDVSPMSMSTYMDVKFTPADPASVLASRVASWTLMIALPPHQDVTQDLMCPISRDLSLLRFTNHMHEYGRSALTEFIDPAGLPLIVPAGSVLHTRCHWDNTTGAPIALPNEMCAFFRAHSRRQ